MDLAMEDELPFQRKGNSLDCLKIVWAESLNDWHGTNEGKRSRQLF